MHRFLHCLALLLFASTILGCTNAARESGAEGDGGTSASARDSAQLEQDKQRILQSLTQRVPGLAPEDVKWQEPEVFYAALTGIVGSERYSGISQVFSREEALESVEQFNKTESELLGPGEEPRVHEIKKMEPIGYRIIAEYEAGSGAERATHKDTYLVCDQVMLINGKFEKQGRDAILQSTSSIAADVIIQSGTSDD